GLFKVGMWRTKLGLVILSEAKNHGVGQDVHRQARSLSTNNSSPNVILRFAQNDKAHLGGFSQAFPRLRIDPASVVPKLTLPKGSYIISIRLRMWAGGRFRFALVICPKKPVEGRTA